MIIDIFCHHIGKSATDFLDKKSRYYGEGRQYPYPTQNADVEIRLGLMDKYGIDIQALSQTTPVLMGLGSDDAAEVCRLGLRPLQGT